MCLNLFLIWWETRERFISHMRYGTKNVAIFIDDVNASIETLELHVYLLRNMYAGCKNLAEKWHIASIFVDKIKHSIVRLIKDFSSLTPTRDIWHIHRKESIKWINILWQGVILRKNTRRRATAMSVYANLPSRYWVPQKLPQIYTVIAYNCIGKVAWSAVYIFAVIYGTLCTILYCINYM